MNASIKRRQTLLINWLQSVMNCSVQPAQSGSQYLTMNTQYTGKVMIRISDHMTSGTKYLNVILSALNNQVIVTYKNFVWSGRFDIAKHVIYAFAMGKAMLDLKTFVDPSVPSITSSQEQVFKKYIGNWKKEAQIELTNYFFNNPQDVECILKFLTCYSLSKKAVKYAKLAQLKQELNII